MVDFFVIDFTEPYRVRYLCFPTRTKRPKAFLGGFEIVGYFVAEKIECGLVLYIWFVQYSKNRGARKRSLNKRFGGFAFSALRGPKIWRSGPKIIIILWSCKFPRYKLPTILLNTEQISVKNIAHLSGSVWLFRLDFFSLSNLHREPGKISLFAACGRETGPVNLYRAHFAVIDGFLWIGNLSRKSVFRREITPLCRSILFDVLFQVRNIQIFHGWGNFVIFFEK